MLRLCDFLCSVSVSPVAVVFSSVRPHAPAASVGVSRSSEVSLTLAATAGSRPLRLLRCRRDCSAAFDALSSPGTRPSSLAASTRICRSDCARCAHALAARRVAHARAMVSAGGSRAEAIDVDADSESSDVEVLAGSAASWRAVKRVKVEHKAFASVSTPASTSIVEPKHRPRPPAPELPPGFCLPSARRARSPSTDDEDVPPLAWLRPPPPPPPRPGTRPVEPSPVDFHAEPRTDDGPASTDKVAAKSSKSWTAYARPGVPAQGFGTVRSPSLRLAERRRSARPTSGASASHSLSASR